MKIDKQKKFTTVFLVGGGTGGPTVPVLAVAEQLQDKCKLFFVGNNQDLETELLNTLHFELQHLTIPAGKWRRYFSLKNLIDLFKIPAGFIKSLYLIRKYKPDVIFGAGSYVQVPVAYAAYVSGVPIVIHQQDLEPILSTKLVFPLASQVTVAFRMTGKQFFSSSGLFQKSDSSKVTYTGNPVRQTILRGSKQKAKEILGLTDSYPTVLVMGGGLGAASLNEVVLAAAPDLVKYVQVIHLTGNSGNIKKFEHEHYHVFDFLGADLAHAYAAADLVVSRAGTSAISELSLLGKPTILVPLPHSPQEKNAYILSVLGSVLGVRQQYLTPELLLRLVRKILWDKQVQDRLTENIKRLMPPNGAEKVSKVILTAAKKNND